ncbi:class I SAM-dependent methyltransferase [Rhizohabitans arisaemae]|uniref:class I SAM-dependent methyltransferase n=1 Tax=Rhizohabitans arisaemae TaxID=2720610 RepID=UPI0024B03E20|nr:SAM-dependent methyltransferase [Rhizohabitans arisaemae]
MKSESAAFLREFIRNPVATGAVAPSSRYLAAEIVAPVPERGDPVIVELGPGTGSFTAEIQRRLGGRGVHIAVEVNERLAGPLARKFPQVDVVVGCGSTLPKILADRGLDHADAVISGLPWAIFPESLQLGILGAVRQVMVPHGAFTTFAYIHAKSAPPGRRFRRTLGQTFEEVVTGRTVWRNLPPALVYHARRPRPLNHD